MHNLFHSLQATVKRKEKGMVLKIQSEENVKDRISFTAFASTNSRDDHWKCKLFTRVFWKEEIVIFKTSRQHAHQKVMLNYGTCPGFRQRKVKLSAFSLDQKHNQVLNWSVKSTGTFYPQAVSPSNKTNKRFLGNHIIPPCRGSSLFLCHGKGSWGIYLASCFELFP